MGYRYLNTGTAVPVFAAEPPLATEGSLYYNSTSDIFYISNGTQWNLVSNASPTTTGGTRTIDALSEGGTFSYDLGDDFTDDVDTDAQLIYTLTSGTMPTGCTLPTTGNSALTGTASGVSSNTNYTWHIKATDTSGGTATQNYQQTINTVVPTVTGGTVTISSVNEGSSASYDVDTNFTFTTGSTFSAYSLQSGSLPSGLSLNTSSGVISGTMGEVASTTAYSFTIRGTDTDGDTADQAYSWSIINVPLSATGGTVTTYSGYKVHTFTSSGTFSVTSAGSVEYLVVAGGGGGGTQSGGGGGAGGYRSSVTGENSGGGASAESALTLSAADYTVTIGAGGTGSGSGSPTTNSTNGGNSVFATTTSTGGGGGARYNGNTGYSGGSGGGGSVNNGGYGAGTSGQGYRGGNGGTDTGNINDSGGGGGGAGEVGEHYGVQAGGAHGGDGVSSSITNSAVYRAGGGGGTGHSVSGGTTGLGGNGGGGNAGNISGNNAGIAGTANTGGGGGSGTEYNVGGGNGGSGVVIIRYAI